MTAHDPILDGERPSVWGGALVLQAQRRTLAHAIRGAQPDMLLQVLAEELRARHGKGAAMRFADDLKAEVSK